MRTITRAGGVALLLAFAPAARAADPADLFPPNTPLYAELHSPADLAPDLAAVVKGSILEDSIKYLHARRDAAKELRDLRNKHNVALLGLLGSPEMLGEFKKFRGVAAGLTGFNSNGDPQMALAVLTGDSQAVGFAARAFLTMEPNIRKVGTVGAANIPVYQHHTPPIEFDPMTGQQKLVTDKPLTDSSYEATFAYVPGLFVVGTNKEAVGEVVRRHLGEVAGGLAGTPGFKAAAAAYRKPGVFFYANVPEFAARFEAASRARGMPMEPDLYGWFRLIVNEKAVKTLAGCVRFRDGGLSVSVGGEFDPAQPSPLLRLLAGPGARAELLQAAPRPATLALAVTFPEKGRSAAVIGFLDAIAKGGGTLGRLPGDVVREIEGKHKLSVADGLIGKTRGATVVFPVRQELAKGTTPLPLVVLHTESPEVAAAWEEFLPKLVAELSNTTPPPQPSSETVGAVKVLSLPGTGLPWKGAVHYARKGSAIAVGLDRKLVSVALGDAAGSVLGGPRPAVFPVGEEFPLVGTLAAGSAIRALTAVEVQAGPVRPLPGPLPLPGQPFAPPGGVPGQPGEKPQAEEAKAWDAFLNAFDTLPPATVSARVTNNELRIELWQPKVQGGFAPVINAAAEWFDKQPSWSAEPGGYPVSPYSRFRGR